MNEDLKKYIENNILPEYKKNEDSHGIEHILYVIKRSFDIINYNKLDVDLNMVYTIAAYHDIGHHIDAKNHEVISAQIMYNDLNLQNFFNADEILIMKEAIEDHRASKESEPRNIYGKIVSTADRNNTIEQCLKRTYLYGKKHTPNATDDELFERAYDVLNNKFGENGYAKSYFMDEVYIDFLKEIRELLKDKQVFCYTQKEYIRKLKNQGIIK